MEGGAGEPGRDTVRETCAVQRNAPYDGPGKLSGSMHLHVGGGHYELTVRDRFDAAHALPGYDGPKGRLKIPAKLADLPVIHQQTPPLLIDG